MDIETRKSPGLSANHNEMDKLSLSSRPAFRVAKYFVLRLVTISLTIVIGVFLTVLIANRGGFVDEVVAQEVQDLVWDARYNGYFDDVPAEQKEQVIEQYQVKLASKYGLQLPSLPRNLRWTINALTFHWGEVLNQSNLKYNIWRGRGYSWMRYRVTEIIVNRFPNTLLLIATANLIVFLLGVPLALIISRNYGKWVDKFFVFLSPISSIPSWVYGIFLIIIFAVQFRWVPVGGMFDLVPPATKRGYIPVVLRHMLLPVAAIVINIFFQCVYTWRTFFLIYAGEDYVELAKAKGLPNPIIEQQYILRPTLPYVMTSFAMTLIGFWQMTTALEYVFGWPGIGLLYIEALGVNVTETRIVDAVLIIGIVVIFAYLMGFTILLLDIAYAILDPRVRVINDNRRLEKTPARAKRSVQNWLKHVLLPAREPTLHQERPAEKSQLEVPSGLPRVRKAVIHRFASTLSETGHYPSMVIGSLMVMLLVGIAVYTVIAIPPAQVTKLWHRNPSGMDTVPRNARPVWFNWFRRNDLPLTIILSSLDDSLYTTVKVGAKDNPGAIFVENRRYTAFFPLVAKGYEAKNDLSIFSRELLPFMTSEKSPIKETSSFINPYTITFKIDYPYHEFPQDLVIYFFPQYEQKQPLVILTWITPDGREFKLGTKTVSTASRWSLSSDVPPKYLFAGIRHPTLYEPGEGMFPITCALFFNPVAEPCTPLPGTYTLRIDGFTFEPESNINAQVVVFGQVYGIAGTDNLRRDLSVGLLWGFPIALAYGLVGAVVTTILSLMVAAAGVWFGGWIDALTQRITEANMILPVLAIGVVVFYYYHVSFWVILGIIVLLNVFGSNTKSFRAAFMQIKDSPYIEAAQAYNASDRRIILYYLVPRILPVLIPQLVALIPTYVFLEATLGIFGVGDPFIPTWGSILHDALNNWAFRGDYYWIAEPISLLLLTGLTFAMFGLALDRILNPKLRDV